MRKEKIIIMSFVISILALCILGEKESPEEYLKGINAARASIGVHPLIWNKQLEKEAQNFLNRYVGACLKEKAFTMEASPYYGQIMACDVDGSEPFTAKDAVTGWVAQKKYYDQKSKSCVGGYCNCYAYLVWKESTSIGCFRIKCHRGCTIVTCLLSPKGKFGKGQRPLLH
ncbi:hypothetical protein PIB30_066316 [Stylosanthes scabra]|uniref:SCP domain-containing protein n=1 Tax=Stylosanthes scabra TaxID=79078 RepID=A0ABU6XK43_9FABA|nr:hypothetical protein [Stylosanthes scabra]